MEEIVKVRLLRGIISASARFMRKIGAASTTALILLAAERSRDPELRIHFRSLQEFIAELDRTTHQYYASFVLVNIIAEVENYLTDVTKEVLRAYPMKIGGIQFKLSEIVGRSEDELILIAAERCMYEMMYKKPLEYLSELCRLASVDPGCIKAHWPTFVEAKARRDLGMHNDWRVNDTYLRKIGEVGLRSNLSVGADVCPDHAYVIEVATQFRKMIEELSDRLEAKFA